MGVGGTDAPDTDGQATVDIDGVLVLAHSEEQDATATWKKPSGIIRWSDSSTTAGPAPGSRCPPCCGPGNAGSNNAADHTTTTNLALAQLPKQYRRRRQTLIRTDSAGGTQGFFNWLTARGPWLSYSVGMTITDAIHHAVLQIPGPALTPAVEPDGQLRDGAWVAELASDVLNTWPTGIQLIVGKKRPYPGAQLRVTDADGMRLTCFATNTTGTAISALELRHRQRARAEDRIRAARDTGLRNLSLHHTVSNQIWLEIVRLAMNLLA